MLYLREHKNIALHVVCGDITDVSLEGEKLILKTTEQFLYDMLSSEENKKQIKKALAWQGLEYELEVVKLKKPSDLQREDKDKLKGYGIDFIEV